MEAPSSVQMVMEHQLQAGRYARHRRIKMTYKHHPSQEAYRLEHKMRAEVGGFQKRSFGYFFALFHFLPVIFTQKMTR